jgi:hypothetical protein
LKNKIRIRKGITAIADGALILTLFIFLESFSVHSGKDPSPMYASEFYAANDTLIFSGYQWTTKESNEKYTGPGRNFFAGGKENVWVDEQDRMHIRTTHRNGRWYCAEARLVESLGYGKYIFHLEANPAKLDKDLVVGFFTYDHHDTMHHHREIDIEFSRWGDENAKNSQYVLQPFDIPENVYRFETDLSRKTRHEISWKKNRIQFTSSYVTERNDSVIYDKYAEWTYKPKRKLTRNKEKFSMNVWIYKADFPSDFNDYEFVVSKFEFIPFKIHKVF